MKATTRKILITAGVLTALVCLGVVAGMLLAGSGTKAKSPVEPDSLPEVSGSPLFQTALANDIEKMEGRGSAYSGGAALQDNVLQAQEAKNRNPAQATVDYTCGHTCGATCGTTCGYTCGYTCAGYTCGHTCDATCGTTCAGYTCDHTCDHTCDATCGTTCAGTCGTTCGSTCTGPTCNGTCGGATCGTTCDATCDGTTCGSDCPSPPDPTPQPKTTSRTWGHDSVGVSSAAKVWYLAEGSTNGGFETWILVQNPNAETAEVTLTYMTPSGPRQGPSVALPANSRKSFNVADTVPGEWEVSTRISSDAPVIAERAMYGPGRAWGHDSIGSSATSKTWYLAEGSTASGFETWILVQNPNDEPSEVTLTYMTPGGKVTGPKVELAPGTRKSFNVADTVPDAWEVSTQVTSEQGLVAERAVYWSNRKGGHESVGVTEPATTWYLAEGSTAAGFETWILVQNPGEETASADIVYMTDGGPVDGPHLDLPAGSRKSVNVADTVPDTWSVSTKVTSKQPVIAERAVYWNDRIEGHASIGTTEPAKTWYLAEGSTGAGFETWVLVQNPGESTANVELTYMTPTGPVAGPTETIAPNSRRTFEVADTVPGELEVSTRVVSNTPVIAERAMYGDTK